MSYKNLQELNDAIIEFAKAVGIDYSKLNKNINLLKQKVDLTDLNLLSNQLNTIINNFKEVSDTSLENKLIELQNVINVAAAAGAGKNGWTDLLIKTASGRTQAQKNADIINVKDFGAKGDGTTNDTQAINDALLAVNANGGGTLYFDKGRYIYDGGGILSHGAVIKGAGRNATFILSNSPVPKDGYLFRCAGYGSGIESMAFYGGADQTDGYFVELIAPESYIHDFFMHKFKNGINMLGNVSRIRHGRFQDPMPDGVGIFAGGGDNSQIIDDVLMGAPNPLNLGKAGIRLSNCIALMITNTSVIGYGVGLDISPSVVTDNVFCIYANNCFFDNNKCNLRILPSGTGGVYRCLFTNCWFGSAHRGDGVVISGLVKGIIFNSCQIVLNKGAGVSLNGELLEDITIANSIISNNEHGIYCGAKISSLKITGNVIGKSADFNGNTNSGIALENVDFTNSVISNNIINGNGIAIIDNAKTKPVITNNIGFATPWNNFNIEVKSQIGSLANYSFDGKYKVSENTVEVRFEIKILDKGTANGDLRFKLPVGISNGTYVGVGREFANSGKMLSVFAQVDTCYIYAFDNTYQGNNGDVIVGNIKYSLT